jgi:murein L,D-transpeptidase YcbB/YkuD
MKNTILLAIIISAFASCNLVAGSKEDNTDSTNVNSVDSSQAFAPVRDASITAANAYSDLFLDSAAVENFIAKQNVQGNNAVHLRNFYKVRNYQFAWFASDGMTEQGRGLWNKYHEQNVSSEANKEDKDLQVHVDSLFEKDTVQIAASDTNFIQTELQLTQEFIEMQGSANAANIYYAVPRKKMEVLQWADSILHKQKDTAQYANNQMFSALKKQLNKYYGIAQNGGWQPVSNNQSSATALKKRLQLTGDYSSNDTTAKYSDTLTTAIQSVQEQFGLKPTGKINDSLVTALNVPVEKRIEQIIINMNRAQWMNNSINDSSSIQVNIPSQMLYVYSDSGKVLEMSVIIGKEGTSTVMFNGDINQIVFNPTWNIPKSIVKNEIMPKMKNDKNYLQKHHIEIVGNKNDSIPELRELPNPQNPLGKVKFLFPNNYEIYLHDTPNKSDFAKKDRTISHGCIRVARPELLAQYLLKDQSDWNAQRIQQAMNSGKEQKVEVKKQTPVQISYYTAWVDKNGRMNFRNDIYKLDERTSKKMFQQG